MRVDGTLAKRGELREGGGFAGVAIKMLHRANLVDFSKIHGSAGMQLRLVRGS
jgi:hypothetical protein